MKPGSLLRVKHFSDSEEDDFDVEMEEDQAMSDEPQKDQPESDEPKEDQPEIEEPIDDQPESEDQPGTSKEAESKPKTKIRKKGIIYISSIPEHMNVAICRELMEQFGEVGRIFLQPDSKGMTKKANKKKKNVKFTEGWVEFEKKKVAKSVAQHINSSPITVKKGSKFCDILWSLKYLPGFKWFHLSERLTYERAVKHQKLQIATSKARKEADFFQNNLDKSENLNKRKKCTNSVN